MQDVKKKSEEVLSEFILRGAGRMKVWIIELEFKNGETEIFEVHGSVMSAMKRCSEINKRETETINQVYMSELEVVNDDHGLMDLDEFQDFVEELDE